MKLKKILLSAMLPTLTVLLFASCEDNTDSIKDYDKDMLSIMTYANDTEVTGGFSFTATEAWTTAIDYGTTVRSDNNNWITIDPASGSAGEVTISITLDENTTGENRNATIKIICGDTTLDIEIVQRGSKKPNAEDDNSSTGDEPVSKQDIYLINKIEININERDGGVVTYHFFHKDNDPSLSIEHIIVEGLDTEGEQVDYYLNYDNDKLHIDTYVGGILYESLDANINGQYIDSYSVTNDIAAGDVTPDGQTGVTHYGIEVQTWNFWRNGSQLYKTDYKRESIFEDYPSLNNVNERSYYVTWEHADNSIESIDYFNNPYNMTKVNWHYDYDENYTYTDYITYSPNITLANVMSTKLPIEHPGSFVDLNILITNMWTTGTYMATGGYNQIFGLLGLTSAPSYNLASCIKCHYGEQEGSDCYVSYELNNDNLISKVLVGSDEIELNIGYQKF